MRKGFFPPGQLAAMDSADEGGAEGDGSLLGSLASADDVGEGELRTRYEQAVRAMADKQKEVESLRKALASAKSLEEAQRAQHRQNVRKMLEANEALQDQLRELNGVVERSVQKALGAEGAAGSGGGTTRQKLPAAAFPQQAKPGSRAQRAAPSAIAPPRAGKQPAPGARPFK